MIISQGLRNHPHFMVWVTVLVMFTAGAAVSNVLVVSSGSALLGSSEVSDIIPLVVLAVSSRFSQLGHHLSVTVTDAV